MESNTRRPSIEIAVSDSIARADIPGLCERVRAMLEELDEGVVVCDVIGVTEPDAVAVDALARLQLTVRRAGLELRLQNVTTELQELIALTGLAAVVPVLRA